MSALARQQQALLEALFAWPPENAINNIATYVHDKRARGLKAYQNNGHVLAQRSLLGAYPVLAQVLGMESFAALSCSFWHAHPPARGDLAQWGGYLADFVTASEQLADEPYLPDVARVEWALHTSAGSADRAAEPATFSLLVECDPAGLRLVLAPGCAVLGSHWPVASIVTAHIAGQPGFDAVGQKLRGGVAETALVWRAGLQPQVREAWPGEADLLSALLDERALGEAVQMAGALDFPAWLPMAVQTGLLLAVEPIQINPPR